MADPNVGFARIRTDTFEYEIKKLIDGTDDQDAVNVRQLALVTAGLVSIIIETTDDLEAIIEAASPGDHFYLRTGTHTVTAPVNVTAANLRVWGAPGAVVNFTGTGALFDLAAGADGFRAEGFKVSLNSVNAANAFDIAATCNNVDIAGVWIDVPSCAVEANIINTLGERTRVRNVDVIMGPSQTATTGVRLGDGDGHRVEGVRIVGTGATLTFGVTENLICNWSILDRVSILDVVSIGISISGNYAHLTTCAVRNAGSHGINLFTTADGGTVRGCYTYNSSPIYVEAPHCTVNACYVENAVSDAIRLGGSAHYTKVLGCTIVSPGDHGVNVGGADYVVVEGNTIYDAGKSAVYATGMVGGSVKGNVAETSAEQGVELAGTSTRNVVEGNSLVNSTGVSLKLSDASDYNVIISNQVPNGIDPGAATHNEVAHNVT